MEAERRVVVAVLLERSHTAAVEHTLAVRTRVAVRRLAVHTLVAAHMPVGRILAAHTLAAGSLQQVEQSGINLFFIPQPSPRLRQ